MANKNYLKSQNSDFIKKIKCNNINSNFNGIGLNIGAPNGNAPASGPIAQAQALDEDEETELIVNKGESGH